MQKAKYLSPHRMVQRLQVEPGKAPISAKFIIGRLIERRPTDL
jgi:hypothetical protein